MRLILSWRHDNTDIFIQERALQNPIETISTQSIIKEAVKTGNPDLLTHAVWSAFYEELYQPLTETFDNNVVMNQFTRDQYLIRKAV